MKKTARKTIGLISAFLICTGSTFTAFADAAKAPYLRGDINSDGTVSVEDAQLALVAYTNQVAKNPVELNGLQMLAANVLSDGSFDVTDAQCILKYYVENSVNKKTVTWNQVSGRDKLTVPDTGDELVICAPTNYYDIEVMIRQFVERHPEYKGKIRTKYLAPYREDENAMWDQDMFYEYVTKANDADIIYADSSEMYNILNNDALTLPVSALGFQDSDFDNMYAYTLETGTNLNSDLKALTATASPTVFAYRSDLAEKYLGAKTPEEMQNLVGTWEGFEKAAKTVHDKSDGKTAFCDRRNGFASAIGSDLTEPWFNDQGMTVVPQQMKQKAELYTSFLTNGYFTDKLMFMEGFSEAVQSGGLFGFFVPCWMLSDNSLVEFYFGDAQSPVYGKYNIVQGPNACSWGLDRYLLVSSHCDNKTLAYKFLSEFTVNEETMAEFGKETKNYMNNSAYIKKLAASDKGYAVLGGQKALGLLDEIANASHTPKAYSASYENLTTDFLMYLEEEMKNGDSLDECFALFCARHLVF